LRDILSQWLLIAVAGAMGALSRYAISHWSYTWLGKAFPVGPLAANVLACYLLGLVMQTAATTGLIAPWLRNAIAIGFLGGLSTFSTVCFDTYDQFQEGQIFLAMANILISLAAGLFSIWLGVATAKSLFG